MGDGRTRRAFPPGTLHVDMNPLMIPGKVGELIDPLLVNRHPFGDTQFLSHKVRDCA